MFKELFTEASDYVIYHKTYTSAIQAAELYANKKGFELDKEEMADKIGMGPGKPKHGRTVKHTLDLYKNGELIKGKKKLQIQVYDRGQSGNNYELNAYIA